MTALLARINARLDDIEAGPAVAAVGLFLLAFIAALIWGWAATPFITVAALVYAQLAYREARAARAEMAKNVNGIHRAGLDSVRALARLDAWEAEATGLEPASDGRHAKGQAA